MPLSLVEPRLKLRRTDKSSEMCVLTTTQKGVSVIQVWEVGGEGRKGGGGGGREEERLLRNDRFSIVWGFCTCLFICLLGLEGCVVLFCLKA